MLYKDISEALNTLATISRDLEEMYQENGGEITPETEALEEQKTAVAELLDGEGIDALGRWLKSKEDEIKTYKAEKEAVTKRIRSVENTIAFIKDTIARIMKETGCEKAKGIFYGFTQYESVTTSVDSGLLKDFYLAKVRQAMHDAGIPDYITVTLGASANAVPEDEDLPSFFVVDRHDAVRFTKPRKSKEDE